MRRVISAAGTLRVHKLGPLYVRRRRTRLVLQRVRRSGICFLNLQVLEISLEAFLTKIQPIVVVLLLFELHFMRWTEHLLQMLVSLHGNLWLLRVVSGSPPTVHLGPLLLNMVGTI